MNKNIKISLFALSLLIIGTGTVVVVNAAAPETAIGTDTSVYNRMFNGEGRDADRGKHEANKEEREANKEDHESILTAVLAGDYETWKELTADKPVSETITADNFSKLKEMHELRDAGQFEEAREIGEELGLKHFGPRDGKGMRGQGERKGECRLDLETIE